MLISCFCSIFLSSSPCWQEFAPDLIPPAALSAGPASPGCRSGLERSGRAPPTPPTSLVSMPLFTDQVVWKYSSNLCLSCWGR